MSIRTLATDRIDMHRFVAESVAAEQHTQHELARMFGVTRQAVSDIECRALEKLALAIEAWEWIGWDESRADEIGKWVDAPVETGRIVDTLKRMDKERGVA